jgi:hypothetical protein
MPPELDPKQIEQDGLVSDSNVAKKLRFQQVLLDGKLNMFLCNGWHVSIT